MSANERSDEVVSVGRAPRSDTPGWWIYQGVTRPLREIPSGRPLPPPPPWRDFDGGPLPANDVPPEDDGETRRRLGSRRSKSTRQPDPREVDMVNAAICLRRPLLVTGPPGAGKSSLAFQISYELGLGRVLRWHVTSRTSLREGLYSYDAIGRAAAAATARQSSDEPQDPPSIGDFIWLGPLGTAFLPTARPRVLLIDELDKSEADLPNDLLGIFEDGEFWVHELARAKSQTPECDVFTNDPDRQANIIGGRVRCRAFPIIVITSNGERDFPPAFLRRCMQLEVKPPDEDKLAEMVAAHLDGELDEQRRELIAQFVEATGATGSVPADRLLEAVFLATSGAYEPEGESWQRLLGALWRQLTAAVS